MRRPPPKSILALGRRVAIRFVEKVEGNDHLMGMHDYEGADIQIKDGMSLDQKKAIVVHEIFHDIEDLVKAEISERDVHAMSSALFAVIRDNPKLIAWLQEK